VDLRNQVMNARQSFSRSRLYPLLALFALPLLSGCNLYGGLGSPSGDAQLLSAARACFDEGDFACALKYYAQLSSVSADQQLSEEAFLTLDQQGAGMGVFLTAFGNGNGGDGVTSLSSALIPGAGVARRSAMLQAYVSWHSITSTDLQGLVQFVAGMALASEMLAEGAIGDSVLHKSDLVNIPSSCATSATACTGGDPTNCGKPTNSGLAASASDNVNIDGNIATAESAFAVASPDLQMLNQALNGVETGLTKMSASGRFKTGAGGLTTSLVAAGAALTNAGGVDDCYRQLLITSGIGN